MRFFSNLKSFQPMNSCSHTIWGYQVNIPSLVAKLLFTLKLRSWHKSTCNSSLLLEKFVAFWASTIGSLFLRTIYDRSWEESVETAFRMVNAERSEAVASIRTKSTGLGSALPTTCDMTAATHISNWYFLGGIGAPMKDNYSPILGEYSTRGGS